MEHSILFAFPPLFVLIVSIWLIINSNKRNLVLENPTLSIFLIAIVGLNTIEFLTYSNILKPSLLLMKLFYIFIIFTLASVFLLTIKFCNLKVATTNLKPIRMFVSIITLFFTFFIFFTESIISGIEFTTYSVTRIPGEYFFLIRYVFIGFSLPIIGLLIFGSTRKVVDKNVKRSRVVLFSFSPLLVSLLIIFIIMEMGFAVNASLVLPIGSAILFLAIIQTEKNEDLFKLLIRIPYTNENISYQIITKEIQQFLSSTGSGDQVSLKTLTTSLEQHIVNLAVDLSNGSQVKAAELLNISTSSMCRKKRT